MEEEKLSVLKKILLSGLQKLYGGAECDSGGLGSLQVPHFCSRSSGEIGLQDSWKIYLQTSNLEIPQTLGTLEKNTFIQIIMGKRPYPILMNS